MGTHQEIPELQARKLRDWAFYQLDIPDDVMPKLLDWDKLVERAKPRRCRMR